jgi:hypothetical protein
VQIFAVVDDARDFRCEANRRAFEQAAGEPDGPFIDFPLLGFKPPSSDGDWLQP